MHLFSYLNDLFTKFKNHTLMLGTGHLILLAILPLQPWWWFRATLQQTSISVNTVASHRFMYKYQVDHVFLKISFFYTIGLNKLHLGVKSCHWFSKIQGTSLGNTLFSLPEGDCWGVTCLHYSYLKPYVQGLEEKSPVPFMTRISLIS